MPRRLEIEVGGDTANFNRNIRRAAQEVQGLGARSERSGRGVRGLGTDAERAGRKAKTASRGFAALKVGRRRAGRWREHRRVHADRHRGVRPSGPHWWRSPPSREPRWSSCRSFAARSVRTARPQPWWTNRHHQAQHVALSRRPGHGRVRRHLRPARGRGHGSALARSEARATCWTIWPAISTRATSGSSRRI